MPPPWGTGLLRCEGQHHQGDDIGQHVIHGAGQVQIAQQVEAAVHIAQGPEEAEQQRRQGDAGGFHWPKIITARARKPKPATPFSNFHSLTPAMIYTMPPRPPSTPGDQYAGVAHPVDVDAHGIRCLGMLAAGAQPQAEAGLVQHHIGDYQAITASSMHQ